MSQRVETTFQPKLSSFRLQKNSIPLKISTSFWLNWIQHFNESQNIWAGENSKGHLVCPIHFYYILKSIHTVQVRAKHLQTYEWAMVMDLQF